MYCKCGNIITIGDMLLRPGDTEPMCEACLDSLFEAQAEILEPTEVTYGNLNQ